MTLTPQPLIPGQPDTWDLLCRVVDHRGDAGVCWRLARSLATRGVRVRLWIDQADALNGMASASDLALMTGGWITALPWPGEASIWPEDSDTLIETFGCGLPVHWVRALADRVAKHRRQGREGSVWINLEYLSAEPYAERSHGLASPQHINGVDIRCWFFYPGFTPGSGGLIDDFAALDPDASRPDDHRHERDNSNTWPISRYDYDPSPCPDWLADWLADWAAQHTPGGQLVLHQPGRTGPVSAPPGVQIPSTPWLTQFDYDRLLTRCRLNLVRGEDSFVRAQWAARPLLWHIYPQQDGAHIAKLHAWLDRYLVGAEPELAQAVREAHAAHNGLLPASHRVSALTRALSIDQGRAWPLHAWRWREQLRSQTALPERLLSFVASRRLAPAPR